MKAKELVSLAMNAGVLLYLENDNLAFKANKGCLTDDLRKLLKQHKAELIAYLETHHKQAGNDIRPLKLARYPLTYSQRRLHFLQQLHGTGANYNLPTGLILTGELDLNAVQRSLDQIVERHEILRTTYHFDGSDWYQQVNPPSPLQIDLRDVTHLSTKDRDTAVDQQLEREAERQFDLSCDPVLAVNILKLSAKKHAVLLTMHHIATDGTSMSVLVDEFMAFYKSEVTRIPVELPPLPFQFGDFAHWQRSKSGDEAIEKQSKFWIEYLDNSPRLHSLSCDFERPQTSLFKGDSITLSINQDRLSRLQQLSQSLQCSLYVVFKELLATILATYGNSNDIIIGSPAEGRTQRGTDKLIGFFANTLVFRHQVEKQRSFSENLRIQKRQFSSVYDNQDLPFERLVEMLDAGGSLSYNPLVQIFLAFQNYEQRTLSLDSISVEPIPPKNLYMKFDLELTVNLLASGANVNWSYATALFSRQTIKRMMESFDRLLNAVLDDPDRPLCEQPFLADIDHAGIHLWNETAAPLPDDITLIDQVNLQWHKTPERVALRWQDQALTYEQLGKRVERLSAELIRISSAPAQRIGLYLPRGIDMVVAMLATLRAGHAYVPLDPDFPEERLQHIVDDAQLDVIVSVTSLKTRLPMQGNALFLDALPDSEGSAGQSPRVTQSQLAYIIYTSGSTGTPKGVMITHRQLLNFNVAMGDVLDLMEGAWLATTAFSFDISILELLCPLTYGFEVVIGSHSEQGASAYSFARLLSRHQITHMQCTPSFLKLYMKDPEFCAALNGLQVVLLGGEPLPEPLVKALRRCTDARVMNMYGPTETTIWSSCAEVHATEDEITIGTPIANTRFYVVDANLKSVPVGVAGELLIGGEGVARGYLGKPDLTEERFIDWQCFGNVTQKVYRTGDLVRYRRDGSLICLGRNDHQVKINGYRIELGEIESAIRSHDSVQEAAVKANTQVQPGQILAFVVLQGDFEDSGQKIQAIRNALARTLPHYMLPSIWKVVDRMPLTLNGKIDRNALPEVSSEANFTAYRSPRTATEKALVSICADLLDSDDREIGIQTSFFELGGHSLLVTRLLNSINDQFGLSLTFADLYGRQSLEDIAMFVDNARTIQDKTVNRTDNLEDFEEVVL